MEMPQNLPSASIDDHMAINIDKVLRAAPTLRVMPDLVVAIANAGGDVERNAQAVGGMHMAQVISQAVHSHIQDNREHYDTMIGHANKIHAGEM